MAFANGFRHHSISCLIPTVLIMGWLGTCANASPYPAEACDRAAAVAGRASGVPISVLRAITRAETGRTRNGRIEPWSWTVNMEGSGVWFDSEQAARTYVQKNLRRGARSFDVGCFQINYKWHGHAFASLSDMFDPVQNARYAADFLAKLFRETGDWSKAAGAYHSRTPAYAQKYIDRFNRIHTALNGPLPPETFQASLSKPDAGLRENRFPLLRAGSGVSRLGSLVPLGSGNGSLFSAGGN